MIKECSHWIPQVVAASYLHLKEWQERQRTHLGGQPYMSTQSLPYDSHTPAIRHTTVQPQVLWLYSTKDYWLALLSTGKTKTPPTFSRLFIRFTCSGGHAAPQYIRSYCMWPAAGNHRTISCHYRCKDLHTVIIPGLMRRALPTRKEGSQNVRGSYHWEHALNSASFPEEYSTLAWAKNKWAYCIAGNFWGALSESLPILLANI